MNKSKLTRIVKETAHSQGFFYCGISKAEFLEEEAPRLDSWLKQNMNGQMDYMANHFDKRLDPRKLMPGTKSIVSLLLNYFPSEKQNPDSEYKLSKYAYGKDYHKVIKKKLQKMVDEFIKEVGSFEYKLCVDSAPVMDKVWAQRSGLGWIGKHTNLINKKSGSFFFIAEILLDVELEYDGPIKDYCGSCTACIDACPTDAIIDSYVVDGSKCISYLTIELKENIPDSFKGKMDDWVFGCDVCQDVCPWNRFSKVHTEEKFKPLAGLLEMTNKDWEILNEETFNKVFEGSAVKRTKFKGIKRNVNFIKPL